MESKIWPKKSYMKVAINAFDLSEWATIKALEAILMHTKDSNLNLYCDQQITGFNASENIGTILDDHGDFVDFKVVPSEKIKIFSGPKIIENAHVYSSGSMLLISVYRFTQNNVDYFVPDESGSKIEHVCFSYNDFYLDGDELSNYLEIRSMAKISTKKNKSTVPRGESKQSLREAAFKHWLATKAGIVISDDTCYQQCYKIINEPTRVEVWEMLQKVDSKLFSSGKDDFIAKQKVIKFKLGTAKRK